MLRGTGDELFVGKFGIKLADFRPNLVNFALEALRLRGHVDEAGKRQGKGRLVEHDLYRASWRLAEAHGVNAGKTQDSFLVTLRPGRRLIVCAGDDEGHARAGRNVH